jgi:hypothetical protein
MPLPYINTVINPYVKGDIAEIPNPRKLLIIIIALLLVYAGGTIYYQYKDADYSVKNALLFSFGLTWMILGANIFSKGLIRILFADQIFQDFKTISGVI